MSSTASLLASFALLLFLSVPANATESDEGIVGRPAVRDFMQQVARRHHYDLSALERIFGQVVIQEKVLESIAKPAEAKPWYAYRKLFLTEARIQGGLNFWNKHSAALVNAAVRYGVPPEMIVAIIGIETSYGQNVGNYRVIDALSTLAFEYPKRADFFRRELEEFLILCREEGIDPLLPKGSYAGAMGMPQFMPSSYRRYAADLEGDHQRDIWNNPADAIASVGNYFSVHGWRQGDPIAFPARISGESYVRLLTGNLKPSHSVADLRTLGVQIPTPLPDQTRANLLSLEEESGPGYWLTLQNFYVISRYNHSPLYAMATFQLSQELTSRRLTPLPLPATR
ncbi:MAG: rane-bound lytic murein transglycosylase [Proteobacteria bacterium]|nr:rane-bound lytic murein transglycosylase [Pseudomonadota bacterium]